MSRKKKGSQNKLFNDFNTESDDFVLADLNTTESDQELSPVPLTTINDDEATIDRLLIKSSVEPKVGYDEQTLSDDVLFFDDVDVSDDSDRFAIGPIEQEDEPKIEYKETFDSKNADLKFDRKIEELYFKDEIKSEEVIPEASVKKNKVSINKKPDKAAASDSASEIKASKAINFKNEKKSYQGDNLGVQINKVTHFNYVALGLSSAALLLGLFVSYKVLHLENQVSKLSDITSILEEDVSTLTEKSSTLGNPNLGSSSVGNTGQETTHLIVPSEPLNKVEVQASRPDIKKKLADPFIEKPIKSKLKKVELTVNTVENVVPLNERTKKGKALLDANKNSLSSHPAHKASYHESRKAKSHEFKKPIKKLALEHKKNVKPVAAVSHNPKPKELPSGPEWVVSLIAYDNEHLAKRKAVKLINQGIPVKVSQIHTNKEKGYRLKVGGFKNKESAQSYASKVKKSLKLNKVTVSFR